MSENGGETINSSISDGNLIIEPKNATHISIRNSYIEKGISNFGGGARYIVNASNDPLACHTSPINKLEIVNTSIIGNMAETGGSFATVIPSDCQIYGIELKAVDFRDNQAEHCSSTYVHFN